MNLLPDELSRYVFSFLNPIFYPKPYANSHRWCNHCGEFLKRGEWISFFYPIPYLDYYCYYCNHLNHIQHSNIDDIIVINNI